MNLLNLMNFLFFFEETEAERLNSGCETSSWDPELQIVHFNGTSGQEQMCYRPVVVSYSESPFARSLEDA